MRDISKMVCQMAMEDLSTAMEVITLVNDLMIRRMEKERFRLRMEGFMLGIGLMMLSKVMEKKRGPTKPTTKETTKMDKNTEKES